MVQIQEIGMKTEKTNSTRYEETDAGLGLLFNALKRQIRNREEEREAEWNEEDVM